MANVQFINQGTGTALTRTLTTSGTANISGCRDDFNLNIQFETIDKGGTAYIKAGDYQNGADGAAVTMAGSGSYVWTEIDGSKARQSDGTYEFYTTVSGYLSTWTRRVV
jgi:hypothetical protein